MSRAPIAIFCYNRPDHIKKTIQSLENCPEINDSEIFIFQDGLKTSRNSELVNHSKVREYIDSLSIGKNKTVSTSHKNKGLAISIREGVDKVLSIYDKIIVIEDDLEVSPGFLTYMNEALHLYENEDQVMHISGYIFPIQSSESTFFLNYTSCWGWGTYKRSWEKLEWDCLYIYKALIQNGKWNHFTLDKKNGNEVQLLNNIYGILNTWAIRWQATIELNNGFCLHPGKSLVQNLGFDGTGINCRENEYKYIHSNLAASIKVEKIPIVENLKVINQLKVFYQSKNTSVIQKIKNNLLINKIADISLRKILTPFKKKSKYDYNINTIEGIPRFTPFSTNARNYSIEVCDGASFQSMWDEIFVKEIYKFTPARDNPVILDIGANIGLSALYFSEEFPAGNIHAYEPDPEVFEYLVKNIKRNKASNVSIHNIAIWKENCELAFHNHGADAGYLAQTVDHNHTIQVKALSFKDLITPFADRISLLKMDIEGAEVETILSFVEGLAKIDNIFVEYHSFENQPQYLNKLLTALSDAGFRYKIFNVHKNMPNSPFINKRKYGNMDLQINIFGFR